MPKKTLHDKVKEATSGPKAAKVLLDLYRKIGVFKKKKPTESPQEKKDK